MRVLIIALITVFSLILNLVAVPEGLSLVVPHIYYIPIILASYWFPKRGVIFSVLIGFLNLSTVYLFAQPDLSTLTYATTTGSFYVLVAIAIVISSLSGGLKEQEVKYRTLFEYSQTGIIIARNAGRVPVIDEINDRGAAILGYHQGELHGQSLDMIWPSSGRYESLFRQIGGDRLMTGMETEIMMKEGDRIPVLISSAPMPGGLIVLTIMDISDRKHAEEAIRSRNRQLSLLNDIIGFANRAENMHNLLDTMVAKVHQLTGSEVCAIYLFDQDGITRHLAARYPATGDFPGIETLKGPEGSGLYSTLKSPNEPMFFDLSTLPPGNAQNTKLHSFAVLPIVCGNSVIGHLFLVGTPRYTFPTEERELLSSIGKEVGCAILKMRLTEGVADANRMANLYLDIIIHDINNANMASLGYGHLLLELVTGSARDFATKLIEGVHRSSDIIRNLDTIRKIHETRPVLREIVLDHVIRSAMRSFNSANITYSGTHVIVLGDDLITEIFSNLIRNSLKFGGAGVRLSIDVVETANGEVEVSVEDNGPGVPDELKPLIFTRFQRGEMKATGKGLGLYIVKSLVERYKGRCWVTDRIPGSSRDGVVIRFTLQKASCP